MNNFKALKIVSRLLEAQAIDTGEADILLQAIPQDNAPEKAEKLRRALSAAIDFKGFNSPGRPAGPRLKGSEIAAKGFNVRELTAFIRHYWKDRKKNSAEFGRLIALLEYAGVIAIPPGRIEAAARYFTDIRGDANSWNLKQVTRGRREVKGSEMPVLLAAVSNSLKRIAVMQSEKKTHINSFILEWAGK